MIFDTHAHYDDEAFQEDRDDLLASLPEGGIGAVTDAASTYQSLIKIKELTERYAHVFGAFGIHPSEIDTVPGVAKIPDADGKEPPATEPQDADGKEPPAAKLQDADGKELPAARIPDAVGKEPPVWFLEELRDLCRLKKAVAVGEIGLDYHWDKDNKKQQIEWFACQIEQARQLQLPVIIHSRDAAADTLATAKRMMLQDVGGVMHCFSYSVEQAREYLNMGLYLGIGGVLTFKNARKLREVVAYAPLEQLVLETDCPYLAPVPHRGERNDSRYLPLVTAEIARIKGISQEAAEEAAWENARRLYRLA
ncbi:MAG: TatD family hydrolase [Eubacterium sp.]|nr:TatD family hydrolase [Eubacterium sp.]